CGVADPSTYRPSPGTIPDAPGVYKFRDAAGRVIYVGKAKSLRSRLNSYFADLTLLHPRTRQMVTTAGAVEWTVVSTEVEALLLRVFPAPTGSAGVFKQRGQIGRPCLLGYSGKCSAPCIGRVSEAEHRDIVNDFCDFLAGHTDLMMRRLEREMNAASKELEF